MSVTGHRTPSMFRRYAGMVYTREQEEALAAREALLQSERKKAADAQRLGDHWATQKEKGEQLLPEPRLSEPSTGRLLALYGRKGYGTVGRSTPSRTRK